ncbi:hypothetical protein C2W62_41285 [Candidatus Entotheonella serta]|nr:hypothetical protein C2W62_41285 [Candidatus Entotheonella serta]
MANSALHSEADRVREFPTPNHPHLLSVHGTSKNDVWAVGERGVALHFDGSQWTQQHTATNVTLRAVRVTEHTTLAVGDEGILLHRPKGK